jgi:hypothetical protein
VAQFQRQFVGVLASQLGRDHKARGRSVVAGEVLGARASTVCQHLAPSLQFHHPVGATLR